MQEKQYSSYLLKHHRQVSSMHSSEYIPSSSRENEIISPLTSAMRINEQTSKATHSRKQSINMDASSTLGPSKSNTFETGKVVLDMAQIDELPEHAK